MNKELLKALGIDEGLPLRELLSELEDKQRDNIERQNGTPDDARREELEKTIIATEQEIERIKKEIREADSSLVFDDGTEDMDSQKEKEKLSKDNTSEKVEAMKKRSAEKALREKNASSGSSDPVPAAGSDPGSAANSAASGGAAGGGAGGFTNDMAGALAAYNAGDFATALRIFSQESEAGDDTAQFMLGHMYFEGLGCNSNYDRFEFWMKRSAEQDNVKAQNYLGNKYLLFGDGKSPMSSPAAKKRYKEGLAWLEKSADSGYADSMRDYITYTELLYSGSIEERVATIRTLLNRSHVNKAMQYCEKLSAASTDSFEKQDWLNKRTALKKGKPYRGSTSANAGTKSRRGGGGCGRFILLFILLFFGLPLVMWLIVSPLIKLGESMEKDADNAESRIVSMQEENEGNASEYKESFGTEKLDLLDMPDERVLDMKRITSPYDYSSYGVSWSRCILFRAGNGGPTAYIDYNIDGKFEMLTFCMTTKPDSSNANAQVQVIDLDSEEILYDFILEKKSDAEEYAELDISGCKNIRLSVQAESGADSWGSLSYVVLKDAILHPEADSAGENE